MAHLSTLPETNSSHLKMDGWNTKYHGYPSVVFFLCFFVAGLLFSAAGQSDCFSYSLQVWKCSSIEGIDFFWTAKLSVENIDFFQS